MSSNSRAQTLAWKTLVRSVHSKQLVLITPLCVFLTILDNTILIKQITKGQQPLHPLSLYLVGCLLAKPTHSLEIEGSDLVGQELLQQLEAPCLPVIRVKIKVLIFNRLSFALSQLISCIRHELLQALSECFFAWILLTHQVDIDQELARLAFIVFVEGLSMLKEAVL